MPAKPRFKSEKKDLIKNSALSRKKTRALWIFVLITLLAEIVAYRQWREWNRPGRVHAAKGSEYVGITVFSKAEEEWLKGIKADPTYPENYERLGDMYEALMRYQEATEMYGKAAKLSPQDGNVWLKYARSLHRISDRDHTIEPARKAASLLPDSAEAQGQFGLLAAENQEPITAHKSLLRAYELAPDNETFVSGLVAIELEMGKLEDAEKHTKEFLSRHPDSAELNFFMAIIYRQKPHAKENVIAAIKHGEQALNVKRTTWRLRLFDLLGNAYLENEQYQKSIKYYQMGRALNPNSHTMVSGLMKAYAASGQEEKSQQLAGLVNILLTRENRKTYLKHALGFNKKQVKVIIELAQIYEMEANYRDARATYELAIKEAPNAQDAKFAREQFELFTKRMNALKEKQEKQGLLKNYKGKMAR